MTTIWYIIVFTFLGSVVSLIGGVLLLANEKIALKISHLLASFAAGALLGTAFLDLLPEALEESEAFHVMLWVLIGIIVFFFIERFVHWFHHHHEHLDNPTEPTAALIILGDSVHNFIDGAAIAASFLVNVPLGIVTTLAVAAHEIPQEIGDFGVLLHKGFSRKKVLTANVFSAFTAIVGAILTYFIGDKVQGLLPILLSITAGFFIYIAASDLIPEIHEKNPRSFAIIESSLFVLGTVIIGIMVQLLE